MAFCRSCIEHAFGGVKNVFRYLARREKLQLDRANKRVQKLLSVVFFLADCKNCLTGNQTSERFAMVPPLLCEYLDKLEDFNTTLN